MAHLIVGLGNPGARYARTYHNAGYMAADTLAAVLGLKFKTRECLSVTAKGSVDGEKVVVAKPETFMNLSGDAVFGLMRAHKVPPANLIIIYDDVDLPRGGLRVRESGSAGTHNGMRHIIERMGTQDLRRIRIGIGPAPDGMPLADYVLSDMSGEAAELIAPAVQKAAETAKDLLQK